MQPSSLPYHPSLPRNPEWAQQHPQQQINLYLQTPAYSSHYAQAYLQSVSPVQPSGLQCGLSPSQLQFAGPSQPRPRPMQPSGSWFQPGNKRCTQPNCTFAGSHKSVEIHMMDRHLIFPPGWEKSAKKPDWDADPSLKGKPIPIQGTNIILDSPEVLDAWIAERRKRFPTATHVEDKKRKMEEAVARGQLTAEDMGLHPEKRRKTDGFNSQSIDGSRHQNSQRGRGNGRGQPLRNRGRGRGGPPLTSSSARPVLQEPVPRAPNPTAISIYNDASSSSDDEGEAPEVLTSKKDISDPPSSGQSSVAAPPFSTPPDTGIGSQHKPTLQQGRRSQPQPKKAPLNPFASRAPLLRNLLLPEIRVTVSNLSQAIRFLVDNDFLRGVEMTPGEARETKIQVLADATTDNDK